MLILHLIGLSSSEEKKNCFRSISHNLVDVYTRDEKCLLRGTNWVFE